MISKIPIIANFSPISLFVDDSHNKTYQNCLSQLNLLNSQTRKGYSSFWPSHILHFPTFHFIFTFSPIGPIITFPPSIFASNILYFSLPIQFQFNRPSVHSPTTPSGAIWLAPFFYSQVNIDDGGRPPFLPPSLLAPIVLV
jgi:hypothetical protein